MCMLWTDKAWSSLNLDLMLFGNYVVIVIMLKSIYVYIYACMSLSDRVVKNHDCLMLMFICINIYMYVISWPDHNCFMLMFIYMYVSMSLFDRVFRDHSCGGMIAYTSKWHEEVIGLMRNQVGRVASTNLWGQYHVDMNWYYVFILCPCLCYGHAIICVYTMSMFILLL